jgi:hypothetical protein
MAQNLAKQAINIKWFGYLQSSKRDHQIIKCFLLSSKIMKNAVSHLNISMWTLNRK